MYKRTKSDDLNLFLFIYPVLNWQIASNPGSNIFNEGVISM